MKYRMVGVYIALVITFALIIIFGISETYSNLSTEQPENPTRVDIRPFGFEDYDFFQKESVDPSNFTNKMNSNDSEDNVHFYLYTKKNRLSPHKLILEDMEGIQNSNFIPKAPLKVIIHGFGGHFLRGCPANLMTSYLNPETREDLNVILVDWSILAKSPGLLVAAYNVPIASEKIAKFIKFLVDQRLSSLDKVHVVGFSLGAQVAGDTGFYINQLMGQKVSRITGLDPAKPIFALTGQRGRIDPSDAYFVDIIHTTGLQVGLLRSLGHADFYVNGGLEQPGCFNNINCLHGRAYEFYSESILYPLAFKACKCSENILSGFSTCPCNSTDSIAYMGEYLSTSARGIYYLETKEKRLYGKG